jgi:hypothetical protein
LCDEGLSSDDTLVEFAKMDHSAVAAAVLLTYRDFSDGSVGGLTRSSRMCEARNNAMVINLKRQDIFFVIWLRGSMTSPSELSCTFSHEACHLLREGDGVNKQFCNEDFNFNCSA